MSDIFSKEKRSYIMKTVKSSNNKSTELKLIYLFKKYSIKGWRRNYKIFGKPDFVFCGKKIAVFTDGCFWHGHNCRNTVPKDNSEYWENKINRNRKRDIEVNKHLKKIGWSVIRIWECELNKNKENILYKRLKILLKDI